MSLARIVVIEDNAGDVELLRYALDRQDEAYDLEVLRDGEAALQFVQEHRKHVREPEPCVILLDLHLPKYDGMVVLHAIRMAPALEHIHVVVLTGSSVSEEQHEIARMGAYHRAKPSSLDDCLALGAEIIEICKRGLPSLA